MSETWTNLLSGAVGAIFGAIVGGTFSLLGTRLAVKQQMATNARWRLYDELLPKLADAVDAAIDPQVPEDQVAEMVMPDLLAKVRRASAIAGRSERKDAHNLWRLWGEHQAERQVELEAWHESIKTLPLSVNADPDPPPGTERPPSAYKLRFRRMRDEIRAFSDKLGAKLG
jgi:hypothetical protein